MAHEDDELILRTKRAGINVQIIDDPFVIHQKHTRTDYSQRTRAIYEANKRFYETVTVPGTFVKPPSNSYYTRVNNPATATHVPLIRLVLGLYRPQFIMELGVGWYSTPVFDNYVKYNEGCTYEGIENDSNWIADVKVSCPAANILFHDLGDVDIKMTWRELSQYKKDLIGDYYRDLPIPESRPNLLFVDNYGACRVVAFNALKDKFAFVIIHDCEMAGASFYHYDKLDTSEFNIYYLKNNLSWTALMVRKGMDESGIADAIVPLIADHLIDYTDVKYMTLTPNYF